MEAQVSEREHKSGPAHGVMVGVRARWQRLTDSVLQRDMALVLALKVALIVALYLFLFRPALHPAQDPAATAAAVAGMDTATVHEVQR
jgi:hypothetical protein